MSDASSVRRASSLPSATGRMASSIRFKDNELWLANGTNWVPLASRGATQNKVVYTSPASPVDQTFFVADRGYTVTSIREVHAVAGDDVGDVNVQVTKDTGTAAPGAGTNLLTNNTNAGFNLKGTANTVQLGTLSATPADLVLAAGDRLSVDYAGTLTTLAGVTVSVVLQATDDPRETVTFTMSANGSLADQAFFLADRDYQVLSISEVHATAGTNGSAVNLQVTKDTSTNAPGAGTNLLTNNTNAGFDLKGAANTVQAGALSATPADLVLAAGDRLAVDFAGTLTTLAGVTVTVALKAL